LALVRGHADRVRPFEDYCVGLLFAQSRKNVEPLAAVTAPERTAAQHLSLLHLVAQARWSDQAVPVSSRINRRGYRRPACSACRSYSLSDIAEIADLAKPEKHLIARALERV
jgi:hypothetical protein